MVMESGWKPEVEISPNCPRCGSSNTKFCYYNNYSLTQPRYFCKGCRRYWTKGGSLRNVPIGGGCRKNRRANKTLRQSSSLDCLTFKNNSHQIGQSYDPTIRTSSSSCSSSVVNDGPNIDLALVYANFLNQKQDTSKAGLENNQHHASQTGFDPFLENSSALNLPQQASSEPYFRSEDNNNHNSSQMCYDELNSMIQKERIEQCSINHDTMNFELPPLPGEDELASSHDLMWSNSSEMLMNHAFQVNQPPPLLGPEAHDPDLLIGNWSPFDLPRDSSFSKP